MQYEKKKGILTDTYNDKQAFSFVSPINDEHVNDDSISQSSKAEEVRNEVHQQEELQERCCLKDKRKMDIPPVVSINTFKRSKTQSYAMIGDPCVSGTRRGIVESFARHLRFERYHTLPSTCGIIAYCIAHQCFYDIIHNVVSEATYKMKNQVFVHWMTFLLGLLISRITGGTWHWISDELYEGLKFDMHNKLRLGDTDALILRWFRKYINVKKVLELVGLYLCFISVSFFLHNHLPLRFCDLRSQLIEELPSRQLSNATTSITRLLTLEWNRDETVDHMDTDDLLYFNDDVFLWKRISSVSYYALMGYAEAALVNLPCSLMFYTISAGISTWVLYKGCGLGLFE